jgi:hypothetical protein
LGRGAIWEEEQDQWEGVWGDTEISVPELNANSQIIRAGFGGKGVKGSSFNMSGN